MRIRFHLLLMLVSLPIPFLWGQVVIPKKMLNNQIPLSLSTSNDGSVLLGTTNNLSANGMSLKKIDAIGNEVWDFKLLWQTANHTSGGFTTHTEAKNGDIIIAGATDLYSPNPQTHQYPYLFRIDPCGNLLWTKLILDDTIGGFQEIYEYPNGNLLVHGNSIVPSSPSMLYLFDAKGTLLRQHPSPIDWADFSESADSNYLYITGSRWIPDPSDSSVQGRFGSICKLNKNSLEIEWVYPTSFGEGFHGATFFNAYDLPNGNVMSGGYSYFGNFIADGIFTFTTASGKFLTNAPITSTDSNTVYKGSLTKINSNKFLAVSTINPLPTGDWGYLWFRLVDSVGNIQKIAKTTYKSKDCYITYMPDNTYMVSFSWVTGGSNQDETALIRIDSNLNILNWPTQDTVAKDPLCISGHPSYIEFAGDSADSIRVVNEWSAWTYWPHIGVKSIQNTSHGLNIYPNPSTGSITVELSGQLSFTNLLLVYDALGRLVASEPVGKRKRIPIVIEKPGIYFVRVAELVGKVVVSD